MSRQKQQSLYKLEQMTKCPVCKTRMKDPRSLPCSHVFCATCIQQHHATENEDRPEYNAAKCPVCRQQFILNASGANCLPRNLEISQLGYILDTFENDNSSSESINCPCLACDGNATATLKCITCEKSMCGKCRCQHDFFLPDHVVASIADVDKILKLLQSYPSMCVDHELSYEKYCESCDTLICLSCDKERHVGHRIRDLNEVALESRGKLHDLGRDLASAIEENEKYFSFLNDRIHNIRQNADKCLKQAEEATLLMIDLLKKKGDAMKDRIEKEASHQTSDTTAKLQTINKVLSSEQKLLSHLKLLEKSGTDSCVVRQLNQLNIYFAEKDTTLKSDTANKLVPCKEISLTISKELEKNLANTLFGFDVRIVDKDSNSSHSRNSSDQTFVNDVNPVKLRLRDRAAYDNESRPSASMYSHYEPLPGEDFQLDESEPAPPVPPPRHRRNTNSSAGIAVSPSGNIAVASHKDNQSRLYLKTKKCWKVLQLTHAIKPFDVAFCSSGGASRLFVTDKGENGRILTYSEKGTRHKLFTTDIVDPCGIDVSEDTVAAISGSGNTINLYDFSGKVKTKVDISQSQVCDLLYVTFVSRAQLLCSSLEHLARIDLNTNITERLDTMDKVYTQYGKSACDRAKSLLYICEMDAVHIPVLSTTMSEVVSEMKVPTSYSTICALSLGPEDTLVMALCDGAVVTFKMAYEHDVT